MSDAATKLAKGLKENPRAGLEAVRLDLHFKLSMYRRHIKQLETMCGLIMEGIDEIKTQLSELSDGTQAD